MLGALIAVLSALSFSLSDVSVRRGVARIPASLGAFVTILLGVPLFAFAALVTGQLLRAGDLSGSGYLLLAAAGIVHYVAGRFFNYSAIGAIGAARSSPIQSLTLPYSVLVAYFTLDEGVTTGMAIGMGLILLGPAIIVERRSAPVQVLAPELAIETPPSEEPSAEEHFELRQAEGYLFAFAGAICYGSSPVLIRAALEDASGLSILGGFVSYIAAAALLLATLLVPGRRYFAAAFSVPVFRAFAPAGFFVFMAQMLRFIALSLASVAVVATLLRFAGLFTLMLSWWFNRSLERITWRVVAGVVMSLAGAVLLVLTRAD
ncbi:MAG TPA: DMT family transporter [Dehalococcoidia bacterium]|nr:DMT family transporter [Dehalococcoidia bacterium]